jgi:hypothetical protein
MLMIISRTPLSSSTAVCYCTTRNGAVSFGRYFLTSTRTNYYRYSFFSPLSNLGAPVLFPCISQYSTVL